MATEETQIRVTGDASGGIQAMVRLAESTARVTAELDRMAAAHRASNRAAESDAMRRAADNVNVWKRAASGVAPQLTGILDSFEEFYEGAESVGLAAMKSRVALLALGSAATAAATATVAAGAAIVASSLDVIRNLDDYNHVTTSHRAALEAASDATHRLGAAMTDLRVEVAGQLAPSITTASNALGGLVAVTSTVAESSAAAAAANVGLRVALEGMSTIIPGLSTAVGILGVAYQGLALYGESATEAIAEQQRQAAEAARVAAIYARAEDAQRRINMEADAQEAQRAQEVADSFILRAEAKERTTTARRSLTTAIQNAAPVEDAAITRAREQAAAMTRQYEILQDLDRAEVERAQRLGEQVAAMSAGTVSGGTPGIDMSQGPGAAEQMADGARKVEDAWRTSLTSVAAVASSVFGTLSAMVSEYTDMQVGSFQEADAAQRRVLRERFRREKAAALAMATIQGAVSVVQTLASTPYPANIILGVLQGAAVAVQIARIASSQPTYHRGGLMRLAPDEAYSGSGARVLTSEVQAVYSDRRAPSESDVARAQTGERARPEEAAPQPMWQLVLDGVRRGVRRHAGPSAGYSPGRMAYGV